MHTHGNTYRLVSILNQVPDLPFKFVFLTGLSADFISQKLRSGLVDCHISKFLNHQQELALKKLMGPHMPWSMIT